MRKLALAAALLAVALAASACDANVATGYAAQVNGTSIEQSTLDSTLSGVASNSGYVCELSKSGTLTVSGSGTKITGSGQSTYNSAFVAGVLDELIELQVVPAALASRHLLPSAFAEQEAVGQLESELTPTSSSTGASGSTAPPSCPGTGEDVLKAFPSSYHRDLIELQADFDELAAGQAGFELTAAGVSAYLTKHGGIPQERCVSIIATTSKGAAQSAAAAIAGGASFASEANKHSLDTSSAANGGAIGCIPNSEDSSFVKPLNTLIPSLKPGIVSSPVEATTTSGTKYWLLVLVTSQKIVPLANDAATLLPTFTEGETELASKVLAAAHVVVAPAYGAWKKQSGVFEVVPPSGPVASLLPNPSAVGASGGSGLIG